MKKIGLFLLLMMTLFTTSSCTKSEETINDEIFEMVQNLITYNWELNNISITYKDYQQEISNYFVSKKEFNAHIKNSELSPIILENVKENDSARVDKYKSQKMKNYDLLDISISKIYGEPSSAKKYVYIHMIVSPNIAKQVESNAVFTGANYTFNEERNILVELSEQENTWKISDLQACCFLVDLKDKLSKEFVSRYTLHNNDPVEYIKTFQLINE